MPALKLKDKDGNWIPLPTIKGADGKNAYQQAVEAGYTGTEEAFYAALVSLKDGPFLPTKGGAMTGGINMGNNMLRAVTHLIGPAEQNLIIMTPKTIQIMSSVDKLIDVWGARINGVADPIVTADAANKGYVDSKAPLLFTGKTVAVSAWASNSTYSGQGYNWRAAVACAGVTTSHRPDVAFGAADAVGGNFAPVADSYNGGVYIYCKTKPTATVTIPSIVYVKGA